VIIIWHPVLSTDDFIRSWQSALGQIDRARALHDLVLSLISLYSFVDMGGDFGDAIGNHLEDVMIRIAVQTIECGIFIQQYMSNTGEWLDILCDGVRALSI
jgi:hypothetical protein